MQSVPWLLMNKYPTWTDPDEAALERRLVYLPMESTFVDDPEMVNPEANVYLKDMAIVAKFERLRPAFALCVAQWAAEFVAGGCKLHKPYETLEEIANYIAGIPGQGAANTAEGKDAQKKAEEWLGNSFVAAAPNNDCPLPSKTCPLSTGKLAGAPDCPCVWTPQRLFDDFGKADKDTKEKLSLEQFTYAATCVFKLMPRIKSRHANVRKAFVIKRKEAPGAAAEAGDDDDAAQAV